MSQRRPSRRTFLTGAAIAGAALRIPTVVKAQRPIGANVVSFPYGPMATQPLGWFKKVIQKPDDFKGLKFRTVGIAIDLFQGMGAVVSPLPAEEIVSAIDRGALDAAEFNNASSDR